MENIITKINAVSSRSELTAIYEELIALPPSPEQRDALSAISRNQHATADMVNAIGVAL